MLVLHAHLPFVKHPEYEYFLEEHWLYEAICETYIPLFMRLKQLEDEGIRAKITFSATPPLCEMLADPMLCDRFRTYLHRMLELSAKEIDRTRNDKVFNDLACFYHERFLKIKDWYNGFLQGNVLNGFRYFRARGTMEVITCGATHGFLPLLSANDKAVNAQIATAVKNYNKHFGQQPDGIWLPECAYYEGLDTILRKHGLRYFFMDTHSVLLSRPRPVYGVFAPVFTECGMAAFGRDYESSKQVWSSKEGYPGDYYYRDFYRDIGYDLDFDYIKPYISPDGIRVFTGIKYHRITGETDYKEVYQPAKAWEKTSEHAAHFVRERMEQADRAARLMDKPPVLVSPYDAELYGHWWFEGPDFLYHVFRHMDQHEQIAPITPTEYLEEFPTHQVVAPNPSSWGDKGYFEVWLNSGNEWIYRHLHQMAGIMCERAEQYRNTSDETTISLLNQMVRELFLAQSSDWAFLMTAQTALEYAIQRTKEHIYNFIRLNQMLTTGDIDGEYLNRIMQKNSLFQEIDFRIYQ